MVTFSIEEFSSISQIKTFSLQCNELASNLPYLIVSNYLVMSKFV